MTAAVGERRVHDRARLDVDPGARWRIFEESEERVPALRMLDHAGELTLTAPDAQLGIDEYRLHLITPFG
jgi:hypothetical protein